MVYKVKSSVLPFTPPAVGASDKIKCLMSVMTTPCRYEKNKQKNKNLSNWENTESWVCFCGCIYVAYLLMLLPSLSRSPAAPVFAARSLPAKSTRLNRLTFSPLVYRKKKESGTEIKSHFIYNLKTVHKKTPLQMISLIFLQTFQSKL